MNCTFSDVSSSTRSLGSQILGNRSKSARKCQQFISTYADLAFANVCTQFVEEEGGQRCRGTQREEQRADLSIKGDHILATELLSHD